jgi:adenylate cyclase
MQCLTPRLNNYMKKILLNPWTALITLIAVALIRFFDPAFVESVRLRYFDQLIVGQPAVDIPVHMVNIDEAALDKYGQFPFPRDIYAKIIQDLYKRDAGLVVFNVLMPESDRFKQDSTLAQTLKQFPVVLPNLAHTKQKNNDQEGNVQLVGQDPSGRMVEYPGMINNVPVIQELAAGVGMVNTFPEVDGVLRRMPLVIMTSNGNTHPAISLEALRVAAGDSKVQIKIGDTGVEALRVPKFGRINTDDIGRIWIDWSKRPKEHSLMDLPKSFNKEIVIVGLSAQGLVNPIATARGEVWPHDMQSSVIGTMLTNTNIQRPAQADTYELLAIVVAGIILIFLMRWTYVGIVATVVTIGSVIAGSIYAYSHYLFLFDSTAFAVGVGLVALHAYMVKFVSEFLQKQQIRKQFQSYLSPDLVAKLIKDPSLLKLGGEEKELSIMFTDVRGFTSISEHYGRNVQGLTSIMNRYMTAMTRTILETGGTLDKYIGDAQMAFWNAPLDETKHCKDAVKAALEMLGSLDGFNESIKEEGVPPFGMGIGINTGVVVVGNMGSEQRFDYTCLGDAVNLSSRLEGQSKNYGVLIVLGPVTAERVEGEYFTVPLDCIAVKGKKEGVNIFTVFYNPTTDVEKVKWSTALEQHNQMLAAYRAQKWTSAAKMTMDLKGEFNGQMDNYYDLWLERIEEMSGANLPSDWDGVYRATSK